MIKTGDAINVIPGDDDGTPFPRDEPQAQNPPDGAFIDYYLKAAAPGVVTLEILDATGKVLRKWPAEPETPAGSPGGRGTRGLPRVSPLWQPVPEVFATAGGMHRVAWRPVAPAEPAGPGGAGGGPRRSGARLTGTFTARLTVQARVSTQSFTVRPDPRVDAR